MTLNELRYMIAVADERHFGRAANRCFVSQPTLSVAIKKLEDELGFSLFERTKNKALLTEKAEPVINEARQILAGVDRIKNISMSARDALSTNLRLGLIYTIGPYLLPDLIPQAKDMAPKMPLIVEETFTATLRNSLKTGNIDAIVVALPFSEPGVATLPLYEEDFVALMPKDHILAKKASVTGKDLAEHSVLLLGEGHCFRDQVLEACPELISNYHSDMQKCLIGSSLETIRHMVMSGVGITVLPRVSANISTITEDALVTRPLASPKAKRTVVLAWRSGFPRLPALSLLAKAILTTNMLLLPGMKPLLKPDEINL